jgi:hypothetical protein
MKIHVIMDDGGNIIGTLHASDGFDGRVIPLPGQNVYELELSSPLIIRSSPSNDVNNQITTTNSVAR